MCTFAIYRRAKGVPFEEEGAILDRLLKELKHFTLLGESAGPQCYAIMLFLWLHGQEGLACQWSGQLVKLITQFNSRGSDGLGVPDPYVDPQDLLKMRYLGETPFAPRESFRTRSFFLPVLIEFLTRRGRKQMLRSLWYDVSEIDRAEFTLDRGADLYRWRAKTGSLDTRRWPHPQQWSELVAAANSQRDQDTLLTRDFVPLILPFSVVYPHRFTSRLAHLIEESV